MRGSQRALLASGISLCLFGAFLMFNGSILGDRTTGIATIMGIIGIGLMANFRKKAAG